MTRHEEIEKKYRDKTGELNNEFELKTKEATNQRFHRLLFDEKGIR